MNIRDKARYLIHIKDDLYKLIKNIEYLQSLK